MKYMASIYSNYVPTHKISTNDDLAFVELEKNMIELFTHHLD